jgi:hypothetical protein
MSSLLTNDIIVRRLAEVAVKSWRRGHGQASGARSDRSTPRTSTRKLGAINNTTAYQRYIGVVGPAR